MPGTPCYLECSDGVKGRKPYRVELRVLNSLPDDLWAVPSTRAHAVTERDYVTAEERKRLTEVRLSTRKPTVNHPRWTGARAISVSERKRHVETFAGVQHNRNPKLVDEFLKKKDANLQDLEKMHSEALKVIFIIFVSYVILAGLVEKTPGSRCIKA